jgi:hypothetical protein
MWAPRLGQTVSTFNRGAVAQSRNFQALPALRSRDGRTRKPGPAHGALVGGMERRTQEATLAFGRGGADNITGK